MTNAQFRIAATTGASRTGRPVRGRRIAAFLLAVALGLVPSGAAEGQGLTTTLSAGVARPFGDLSATHGNGVQARAQVGLDLLLVGLHAQGGWTRFPGLEGEAAKDLLHAGIGARVGLGLAWVGGTAAWFTGDDERKIAYIPEIGVGLGPIEAVVDARVAGRQRWWGLRAGIRF